MQMNLNFLLLNWREGKKYLFLLKSWHICDEKKPACTEQLSFVSCGVLYSCLFEGKWIKS